MVVRRFEFQIIAKQILNVNSCCNQIMCRCYYIEHNYQKDQDFDQESPGNRLFKITILFDTG